MSSPAARCVGTDLQRRQLTKTARPTKSTHVSILDDVVTKTQNPGASRRERLRTLAGAEVGRRTGLFTVPDIVSYDDARGEIVFRRLRLMSMREALSQPARAGVLMSRVAEALSAIHAGMKPIDGAVHLPESTRGTDPARVHVPLHGDFGMRNLFYIPDTDGLAIIDWSNAGWMEIDVDMGPPEIDITVLLMSLFHRRFFGRWPIRGRHKVARRFLETYAARAPQGLDLESLRESVSVSSPRFNRQTRRLKGPFRSLGWRHNTLDLRFFLHRFADEQSSGLQSTR